MLILKWTSPVRQGGLSPIPNEVYMEIFSYLRPLDDKPWTHDLALHRRNFSRVALVCRFFYSVMLPWMFESIELGSLKQNGSSSNHSPFCRSIINGCGSAHIIAACIKRCSFSWQTPNPDALSWLYSKALALMPNVEELKLSDARITKHLLGSMIKLKCLTSLLLEKYSFGTTKDKDVRKLSVLRLKSLHCFLDKVSLPASRDELLLVSSVCLDSLLTLHTDCMSFLTRIAEQDYHLPLQELDVDTRNVGLLLPGAFQKIPALKRLSIFDGEISQEIQFDDVLPVLEELCCPSYLLRSLVPGRPISSIGITMVDWCRKIEVIDIIQSLSEPSSTGRIRSLSVPANVYQEVWKHFPDLKSLELVFTVDLYYYGDAPPFCKKFLEDRIPDMSHTWFRNLPVQELHLVFPFRSLDPRFDLEWQHKIISTIFSPRLPQLRRTIISNCVVWDKIQENDVWKPSLRASLLWFAGQLRDPKVYPVNYDGFFEQILSIAEEFL